VLFLKTFGVRPGYEKYGAAAYFDSTYHLLFIELPDGVKYYPPKPKDKNNPNDNGPSPMAKAKWMHAKWAWKVSITVTVFLVDMLAHCRFREASIMAKALQDHLPANHPIRRFMTPFTLGTVYSNRVLNEHLRRNGLYHRAFAFTYDALQSLIRESMTDATSGANRGPEDLMKYRFRLFRKKMAVMKKLPDQVLPLYNDSWDFWLDTLKFSELYVQRFYNADDRDDSKLKADKALEAFFTQIMHDVLPKDSKDTFTFKKFNLINILTHFICNATIWNHHMSMAVSFEYSVDIDYVGLKVLGNNAQRTNVENYAEYCAVVLSRGWEGATMMKQMNVSEVRGLKEMRTVWRLVLLEEQQENDPEPEQKEEEARGDREERWGTRELFDNYFGIMLADHQKKIQAANDGENGLGRIAPYNGCNPKYLQSSVSM